MANKRINTRIDYKQYNAQPVLLAVEKWIRILEARQRRYAHSKWLQRRYGRVDMDEVFDELSIFDWWVKDLTLSHLKQMRTFLREAVKLGYTGYVCFKVGATGCANGMWANKLPSVDGYSPNCDFLYRSFTPAYTYWDITYRDAEGGKDRLSYRVDKEYDELKTIRDLEEALRKVA